MPRVSTKKAKVNPAGESSAAAASPESIAPSPEQTTAAETAAELRGDEQSGSAGLRPPSTPVEPTNDDTKFEERRGYQRDKIVASLNIAKLQAMTMTELNKMARELGVENFGTMRKHEVISHVLQKNAERAGVLFSEGVLEILPEGFGFLRSQSFNYLPC
ncbi:MAG: Rho termination factor N-terminal domain-containing protein, partial [Limisphaerales bacterium]